MQETKFKIQQYGDDNDFMLVRIEDKDWGEGLPPTWSQTIHMNKSEIESLIQCLLEMK